MQKQSHSEVTSSAFFPAASAKIATISFISFSVVTSSVLINTQLAQGYQRLIPLLSAIFSIISEVIPGIACTHTVSKNCSCFMVYPSLFSAPARVHAIEKIWRAMRFSPSGPWYWAYIPDMVASSACAVHMLEVARSRLICCSRVCSAIRSARFPCASIETPISRPGMLRFISSLVAKNPACGPP